MNLAVLQEAGRTPEPAWGFPYLSRATLPHKVRRLAVTLAAVAALAAAIPAMSAAVNGVADAGVQPDLPGGTIQLVTSTGFAWRDGIRVGQTVVAIDPADSPTGWRLETKDPDGTHISRAMPVDEALQASRAVGIGALALAFLACVFLRTHRSWSLPAAAVGLQLASVPLWIHGNPELSTWSMAAAALMPGTWLVWRLPTRPVLRAVVGAVAVLALFYWAVARLNGLASYDPVDAARAVLAAAGTAAIVIDHGLAESADRVHRKPSRVTAADGAVLALLGGAGLALTYFFAASPFVAALLVGIGLLALPRVRSLVGRRLQDLLLADVREQAKADAIEEERARFARELHDVPLQQLQAIMRRLELVGGAETEVASLEQVADGIRGLAIDLRPPVLDDLGLRAALEFLADETSPSGLQVAVDIADDTGILRESRPPEDVELAVYRIAQEAILNALKHGRPTHVSISGSIGREMIELAISDDGTGIGSDRLRVALATGRIGMASMRRRAQAIGAELSIDGRNTGTTVRLQWAA
jgi:signal transduction histidine kinase